MAQFKTRRFIGPALKVIGHSFEDIARSLEEWADKIMRQVEGGIPGGFNGTVPPTITLNDPGTAGTESAGWMAADARAPLNLGLSAKGDLLSHNGLLYTRVAQTSVPAGWVLTADPSAPSGFTWAPPASSASSASVSEISDASLRATFDSLALRDLIARNYR